MSSIKQESRLLAIKTSLGPDVLAVRTANIQEQISRLFEIDVELSSENGEIDLDKVVGHNATLRLDVGQKDKRYFNGFVSRLMEQEGIYYFFQHEDGKHTLILADSISAHKPFNGYSEVIFHELEKGATGREVITDWTVEKELQ